MDSAVVGFICKLPFVIKVLFKIFFELIKGCLFNYFGKTAELADGSKVSRFWWFFLEDWCYFAKFEFFWEFAGAKAFVNDSG